MYVHATLELNYAGVGDFLAMAPKLKGLCEEEGWKMVLGLLQQTGRFNTVIHIWKVRDMNHYHEVVQKLYSHPEIGGIFAVLAKAVEKETVVFADTTPYGDGVIS
ncbi:MAG: hypothetical protein WC997_14525 [Porticoccaceae bacterium]